MMNAEAFHFRVPSVAEATQIRNRLSAFNQEKGASFDTQLLELAVHDEQEELSGALLGWTLWSWFHIDSLWVNEGDRGKGVGSKLLREAERLARARGCEVVDVDTFNFQAYDFYVKQGYQPFGELSGIDQGRMTRYYLKKSLIET